MGGVGSGNWYRFDKKTTTGECQSIDVRHLHRESACSAVRKRGNRGCLPSPLLYASAAQRKPELPVELSGVFELRAATL